MPEFQRERNCGFFCITMEKQHWFITGVSGGLGRAMALEALRRGHTVSGTLRQESQIAGFEELAPGRAFGYLADVRDRKSLSDFVNKALEKAGPVHVLVNNAGYGLVGAIEELSEEEFRQQMEVNFFGSLALIQEVLPHFRAQKRGHIFNISSIAGMNGSPGLALYNASKFALEGLSEGLMLETRHLGIKVTIVEPGPFRTKWAGGGLVHAAREIADYQSITSVLRQRLANVDGNQPGSPEKAAALICDVALSENAPLRLLLGKPGYQIIEAKIKRLSDELAAWKEKGEATDYAD